jgi:hypothetical protein
MLIAKIPCRFDGKLGPAVWNATSDKLARCVQLHEARDAQLFVERWHTASSLEAQVLGFCLCSGVLR